MDHWTLDLAEGVKDADWVVLATRVGLVCELGIRAIPLMKNGAILSDVGSTKTEIVAMIEPHVRPGVRFLGMHPLAGSERRGVEAANAALFAGSMCILTPTKRSHVGCVAAVSAVWRALGARVTTMSPAEHDLILAQVSHLPHLAAACLLNAIDGKALAYGAGGLRSATRIAASDPALWLDIFRSNRRNLLDGVERLEKVLEDIRGFLSVGDDEALLAALTKAQKKRQALEDPLTDTNKKGRKARPARR